MQQPCSQCNTLNPPDALTCASCGAVLRPLDVPTPALSEPAPDFHATLPAAPSLPPPPKTSPGQVLLGLAALLLMVALIGGGVLLTANHPHSAAKSGPLPLYASTLTQMERSWTCEQGAYCQFETNGLHILATTDHLYFSTFIGQQFSDQAIEVKARLDNGDPDIVGVVVAFRSIGVDGYGFLVYASGAYELVKWDPLGNVTVLVPLLSTAALHTGLNQVNDLKVTAKGDEITIFINGIQLNQVHDATYASGNLLLGAARIAADAVFSNLTITKP